MCEFFHTYLFNYVYEFAAFTVYHVKCRKRNTGDEKMFSLCTEYVYNLSIFSKQVDIDENSFYNNMLLLKHYTRGNTNAKYRRYCKGDRDANFQTGR